MIHQRINHNTRTLPKEGKGSWGGVKAPSLIKERIGIKINIEL